MEKTENKSFPVKTKNFSKSVVSELQKVKWPNRSQVISLTGVVIAVVAIIGAYLGGLDFVFSTFINWFLGI